MKIAGCWTRHWIALRAFSVDFFPASVLIGLAKYAVYQLLGSVGQLAFVGTVGLALLFLGLHLRWLSRFLFPRADRWMRTADRRVVGRLKRQDAREAENYRSTTVRGEPEWWAKYH